MRLSSPSRDISLALDDSGLQESNSTRSTSGGCRLSLLISAMCKLWCQLASMLGQRVRLWIGNGHTAHWDIAAPKLLAVISTLKLETPCGAGDHTSIRLAQPAVVVGSLCSYQPCVSFGANCQRCLGSVPDSGSETGAQLTSGHRQSDASRGDARAQAQDTLRCWRLHVFEGSLVSGGAD